MDLECLLLKQQSCQNNPNKSYTERKAIHEPCGYSLDLVSSFDLKENRHSFYRGKDCIKKFCKELKKICVKIVNYEQKEMIPLTDKEKEYDEKQEKCYIYLKKFCKNKKEEKTYKLYQKVRDHWHFTGKFRGAAHAICNLRCRIPYEKPVKFHNGSNYGYHHIIKELAEEFKEGDFECLAENGEKYISFSIPSKKIQVKDTNEIITYRIKFIDSYRFMNTNLSSLVNNFSKIKDHEKCQDEEAIKDLIKTFLIHTIFAKVTLINLDYY